MEGVRVATGVRPTALLVDLVAQDLAEDRDVVVVVGELVERLDDRRGVLDNQGLEPVALVQVGVHVLLQGLLGEMGVEALLVDWDGLYDSKIATAKVDCGGPIRDEMIRRGSLKWVNCDEIEVLPNALPESEKDEL